LPSGFALKPNRGLGGEGILVVYGRKKGRTDAWVKADKSVVTIDDLKNHIRNILDGNFSVSGVPSVAFFEERLQLLKLFKPYAYRGIPDIRIIVYNKIPVMAMLRLPTKASEGKANLQQGAVGVGIDLATGITTSAIQGKTKIIEYAPGTRLLLSGIRIPYWKNMLDLAVRAQEISGLGFLGADIAIDREYGPVFLELNARAGLSIQIANLDGLKERLERIDGLKIKTAQRGVRVGVRVGMDLFGGEVEEEVEEISGKRVIGPVEKVKLIGRKGKEVEVEAKIDTGAGWSSIDSEIAKEIGFEKTVEEYDKLNINYQDIKDLSNKERWNIVKNVPHIDSALIVHSSHGTTYRPMVKVNLVMDKRNVPAKVTIIDRAQLKYPIIIGRRNLGKFLIDVGKS